MRLREHQSNTDIRRIFDDFPALIWRSGIDMKCDYFNNTWLAFTGRSLEQEIGDGWTEGVHPDDLASCVGTYVESFGRRAPFTMHYRLMDRSGKYRWIRDIGRPFFDLRGRFQGYIGSCYDVTEEIEREKSLEEINLAKDKFFSIVAHDLVGPISAIESMSGMLERDHGSFKEEELVEFLHALGQASSNLRSFLDDVLIWARSQLNGITCEPQEASLLELCAEAISPLNESARIKDISINCSLDPSIRALVDVNMAKTIVRNLVANAIKFCYPHKSVDIAGCISGNRARLSVSDQGIGIPQKEIEGLFAPGSMAQRNGTAGERGTGLGLTICKEFAEKNGGSLHAESRYGEGSAFTLELPLAGSAAPTPIRGGSS
jgi:PAS domain S-box-containing protein